MRSLRIITAIFCAIGAAACAVQTDPTDPTLAGKETTTDPTDPTPAGKETTTDPTPAEKETTTDPTPAEKEVTSKTDPTDEVTGKTSSAVTPSTAGIGAIAVSSSAVEFLGAGWPIVTNRADQVNVAIYAFQPNVPGDTGIIQGNFNVSLQSGWIAGTLPISPVISPYICGPAHLFILEMVATSLVNGSIVAYSQPFYC